MAARRENGVWVNDSGELATIIVNADGTAVSAGGGGGTSSVDDAAFTVGVSSLTPVGGVVTSDSVDAGDVGAFAMLANRQQKITLYDSSGVEVTSFGGGTQYTEDAAAAANPVGNAMILVRADTPAGRTTTDGDNVVATGTDKGELYVKHTDAIPVTDNGSTLSIDDGGGAITVDGTVGVSGTVTVDGSGATQPVSHAALTELAAAINASSQMDVNVAAGTVAVTHAALTELGSAIDTEVQCDIVGALPAGTNAIGKLAANSGVDIGDVDVTSISAGTNAIGNVGLIGRTTGGLSIFRSIDLDESEEEVKATAGQVFSITAFNRTAAPLYLKLYNDTAANVSVGTTTPAATFVVPANADSDGSGFVWNHPIGLAFSTAICAAATTGVADNDTGAPGANDCVVVIGFV